MKIIKNYITGIFQISESERASTIIMSFLLFVGLAVWTLIERNSILPELKDLIIFLGGIVATVNIGNKYIESNNSIPSEQQNEQPINKEEV